MRLNEESRADVVLGGKAAKNSGRIRKTRLQEII